MHRRKKGAVFAGATHRMPIQILAFALIYVLFAYFAEILWVSFAHFAVMGLKYISPLILLCIANTGLTAIRSLCIANKGLIGISKKNSHTPTPRGKYVSVANKGLTAMYGVCIANKGLTGVLASAAQQLSGRHNHNSN